MEIQDVAVLASITASLATVVIVGVLLWQTSELKKTSELSHSPRIVPRQRQDTDSESVGVYHIQNVGTASAINIDITLKTENDKQRIRIIALAPMKDFSVKSQVNKDQLVPLIACKKGDTISIDGSYENIRHDKKEIHDKFPVNEIFPMED